METSSQTNGSPTAETKEAVKAFVRSAVLELSGAVNASVPVFEEEVRFERGTDGHFRERKKRVRSLWSIVSIEWLPSRLNYEKCVGHLMADSVVGAHLNHLVGVKTGTVRLDAENVLISLINAMFDDDGKLNFSDDAFDEKWQAWFDLFQADQVACKTVAPLLFLMLPTYPLRLNEQISLDRLTADEVTRCYFAGVLRPTIPRFPLIYGDAAVGVRRTAFWPKLVLQDHEPFPMPDAETEGTFGNRPAFRDDLVTDDVLSALRLLTHTYIRIAGRVSWADIIWLNSSTAYQVLANSYGPKLELSETDVSALADLWSLLEKGASRFGFSIHRFNLAFERGLIADRIVDLVIAAEALFLGDIDENYRGELRFRCAVRAAKFIEYPKYSQQDVYRIMRRAYDARSAVVHGGAPKDTRLPDDPTADLTTFTDAVEDLVRVGLRKALSMEEGGTKLRQAEFWDGLLF